MSELYDNDIDDRPAFVIEMTEPSVLWDERQLERKKLKCGKTIRDHNNVVEVVKV